MSGQKEQETDMLDYMRNALSPTAVSAICWVVLIVIIVAAGASV